MVGKAMALDLSRDYEVTCFDLSRENLEEVHARNPEIKIAANDLSDYSLYADFLQPFDLVITAVPGFMGYKTLETVISAGKNVVDISFFPEDSMQLDALAKKMDVTAITDCGVAPGMSNLILGRYNAEMKINEFECYVGGLPMNGEIVLFFIPTASSCAALNAVASSSSSGRFPNPSSKSMRKSSTGSTCSFRIIFS